GRDRRAPPRARASVRASPVRAARRSSPAAGRDRLPETYLLRSCNISVARPWDLRKSTAAGEARQPMARPIVFLSDFGYRNEWVGICHSVIATASPDSRLVDLSHGVPPLDVRGGALLLHDSRRFLPGDAVVLAVV